jgi:hypothetical protein
LFLCKLFPILACQLRFDALPLLPRTAQTQDSQRSRCKSLLNSVVHNGSTVFLARYLDAR